LVASCSRTLPTCPPSISLQGMGRLQNQMSFFAKNCPTSTKDERVCDEGSFVELWKSFLQPLESAGGTPLASGHNGQDPSALMVDPFEDTLVTGLLALRVMRSRRYSFMNKSTKFLGHILFSIHFSSDCCRCSCRLPSSILHLQRREHRTNYSCGWHTTNLHHVNVGIRSGLKGVDRSAGR
jgi:hypothetical protein